MDSRRLIIITQGGCLPRKERTDGRMTINAAFGLFPNRPLATARWPPQPAACAVSAPEEKEDWS